VSAVAFAELAVVAATFEFPVLKTTGGPRLVTVATRRTVVAVKSSGPPIVAVSARRTVIVATPEGALLAVATKRALLAFARSAALVEFLSETLFPVPTGGAPFAAHRAVMPAAGSVVFVIVAGHEGLC
jgi:hypothetical protein